MSEYGNYTLDEYRDALASGAPTPGGGTAAAVALSQGAALALMVCNLTEGKMEGRVDSRRKMSRNCRTTT